MRQDKKLGATTTVLGSHKNSVLSTKNENHVPKGVNKDANGPGARQATKTSALLGHVASLKPVKSTQGQKQHRDAAGGQGNQRSASVMKQATSTPITKTDKNGSGLSGVVN